MKANVDLKRSLLILLSYWENHLVGNNYYSKALTIFSLFKQYTCCLQQSSKMTTHDMKLTAALRDLPFDGSQALSYMAAPSDTNS